MRTRLLATLATGMFVLCFTTAANAALIAHWGFDETGGSTAFDSVGSVDGALTGGVAFTTTNGILGGAIEITDGFVSMGNNFPSTSTFSIQAWAKTDPGDTTGMMVVSKHWSGIGQGYFLSVNNISDGYTQTNLAGFYSANGGYVTAVGGPAVNDGLWHQLVGVYDNGVTSIYVDGSLAGTGSAGFADNTASFIVGGLTVSGNPVNAYHGLIDEVSVYDNALSAGDVLALYNSAIQAVPEPSSLLLFGTGIAALAGIRLRRKK